MRIGICVGEASGDTLAAELIKAIKRKHPEAEFVGIAGPQMLSESCKALFPVSDLSVMGVAEVLPKIPKILRIRKQLLQYFLENPPDIFIGVDAPDFNLPLEAKLKAAGIKTAHFVSPTIWAWREGRVHKIKKSTDLMLCLFPFELSIYEKYKVPAVYVGHPAADKLPTLCNKHEVRQNLGYENDAKVVALLPGSRKMEIERMGKLFLEAAHWLHRKDANIQFILPLAKTETREYFDKLFKASHYTYSLKIIDGKAYDAIKASDVVLVTSGTATLESFLLNRPMVVVYKMGALNWFLAKLLVKVKYIALPNIIADAPLVPEMLQHEATAENCGRAVLDWLKQPEKVKRLKERYKPLQENLRRSAAEQAANAILKLLHP
jgi:lipid-A-disaccharide synthase